jgi:hypothetical protein
MIYLFDMCCMVCIVYGVCCDASLFAFALKEFRYALI